MANLKTWIQARVVMRLTEQRNTSVGVLNPKRYLGLLLNL